MSECDHILGIFTDSNGIFPSTNQARVLHLSSKELYVRMARKKWCDTRDDITKRMTMSVYNNEVKAANYKTREDIINIIESDDKNILKHSLDRVFKFCPDCGEEL